jgi:hypothetical protein
MLQAGFGHRDAANNYAGITETRQSVHVFRQQVGRGQHVLVQKDQPISFGLRGPEVAILAAPHVVVKYAPNTCIAVAANNVSRAIGRTIIADNDLKLARGLLRQQALNASTQVTRTIVHRDDYADHLICLVPRLQ